MAAPNPANPAPETGTSLVPTAPYSDVRALRREAPEVSYRDDARANFMDGDVLCFRGKGLSSFAIRTATSSDYSHCGLAYRFEDRVYCLEALGAHGVRLALMSVLVDHYKGGIDYFHLEGATAAERKAAIGFAFQQLGKVYDHAGIMRFAQAILFKKKTFVLEDEEWFCSELIAAAYEHAARPIVKLQAAYTSPADLVASRQLTFQASLKP